MRTCECSLHQTGITFTISIQIFLFFPLKKQSVEMISGMNVKLRISIFHIHKHRFLIQRSSMLWSFGSLDHSGERKKTRETPMNYVEAVCTNMIAEEQKKNPAQLYNKCIDELILWKLPNVQITSAARKAPLPCMVTCLTTHKTDRR